MDASITAYGVGTTGKGGSLSITAPVLVVGGIAPQGNGLSLTPDFFSQGGFSSFSLTGIGEQPNVQTIIPGITIAAGTTINPAVMSYAVVTGPAGITLTPTLLPAVAQSPISLTLKAPGQADFVGDQVIMGNLSIEQGVSINLARPRAEPAPSLSVRRTRRRSPDRSLFPEDRLLSREGPVHSAARLSRSISDQKVSCRPRAPTFQPSTPLAMLSAPFCQAARSRSTGNIVAEQGALLDVSGASGSVQITSPPGLFGSRVNAVTADSNGGAITLTGSQELFLLATLRGAAGGLAAAGGSLTVSSGQNGPSPTLIVTQSAQSLSSFVSGNGYFNVDSFTAGGFDSLTSGGFVDFSGPVTINARQV